MLPLAAAFIALVTQDPASLRASASSSAPTNAVLYLGEALEVRGARAGFLQAYHYDRERAGYVLQSQVRQYPLETTNAASVLENVRLLRDVPGLESLGIAHAALYLKLAAPCEVARGYGVRFVSVSSDSGDEGRTRTCYDGEAWRQVIRLGGTADALARAVLGLTSLDCETGSVAERQAAHEQAISPLAAALPRTRAGRPGATRPSSARPRPAPGSTARRAAATRAAVARGRAPARDPAG
jgi:hypothetical protein